MPSRGHSHWPSLLAVSAAVHALGLWLVAEPRPGSTLGPAKAAFVMVPIEVTPTPPAPPAAPTPRLPATPHRVTASATPSGPSQAAAAAAAPGEAVSSAAGIDAPRDTRNRLTPRLGAVIGLEGTAADEPAHGSTVRNGPGEFIDQAIAREVEGEQLTRRLNAELLADVGTAAVGVGTVPGHFRRAESSMRALLKGFQVDRTPLTAKQIAEDVAKTMFSGGISDSAARKVADSPLGQSVRNQTVSVPNTDDNRFREQGLQLMAGVEALKERASAARLKTVLQLTTDPTGAVADVTVVERSGDARFDESVLHLSRKVFRRLPEDDEKALGSHWWQTKWQFTWEPPDVRVRLLDAHRIPPAP